MRVQPFNTVKLDRPLWNLPYASNQVVVRPRALTSVPLRFGSSLVGAHWDLTNHRVLVMTPGRNCGRDDLAWWWVQW